MKELKNIFLSFYVVTSVFAFLFGIANGAADVGTDAWETCNKDRLSRIEYIAPAFRVGCWFGGKP